MSVFRLKSFVALVSLAAISPGTVSAQFLNPFNNCGTCAAPMVRANPCVTCARPVCNCATPAPRVSFRDVVETRYRNEQFVQQVPVTRHRNVAVDEGSYQTVWVPRIVTRQVAETVLEQRIGTRAVPFQVTRRVPQFANCGVPAISIAPSQPVQLQTPISYYGRPSIVPPVQSYRPGSTSRATSGLVPDPRHLDPPTARSLNDLSTTRAPYDSQITRSTSPVKSRSAASVFRRYR